MCNCGNKRNALANEPSSFMRARYMMPPAPDAVKTGQDVFFVYTGQTALSITGRNTGITYRFNAPGEKQLIDYGDASYMATIPVLKRI